MKPRIAIGGIWHETNTFASGITTYQDFKNYQFTRADEMIPRYLGTNTELGGVIGEASKGSFTAVPTLYAAAVPSATIERKTAQRLCDELIDSIKSAAPPDAVILTLHGAAVAEGVDDFDALILERTRHAVGFDVPIVATFDYHANLSEQMVDYASVLIGYDTYPHVDMEQRGAEAAAVAMNILESGSIPRPAFRRIPLLTVPLKQQTDVQPMRDVMQQLHKLEKEPDIVCGSVAMGFPYCDVPHLGASVLFYGDHDSEAQLAADSVALQLWASRELFAANAMSARQGVEQAVKSSERPVVVVEAADNVGGGSSGDGTAVLKELLAQKAASSVIVMADPEAVQTAKTAGVGNEFRVRVGGKMDDCHAATLEFTASVKSISDGTFIHKGSYMTGFKTSMGETAVIESEGIQIVLTSLRTMPFDAEHLRCVGIEPASLEIIVVKSAIAWKAAFGDIARKVIVVDTPGACAIEPGRLNYRLRPRPLYPLDTNIQYSL